MMLRILLVLFAIFIIASMLQKLSPQAEERARQRKKAWSVALRQTAYTVAALLFAAVTAFAVWHGLSSEDTVAAYLALVTGPLGVILGWLAYRAGRPR